MDPFDRPPRSFASIRALKDLPNPYHAPVNFFRGLDEISNVAGHMTRRGIVKAFVTGMGGLIVACAPDGGKTGGGRDDTGSGSSGSTDTTRTDPTDPTNTTETDTAGTDTTDTDSTEDCDDTTSSTPTDEAGQPVGIWVSIGVDGGVTIGVAKNEMGQGIATAFAQMVAEELDVDWGVVRVVFVPEYDAYSLPGWSDGTWGSVSIMDNYEAVLEMGAAARIMLVTAAAARWGVGVESITTSSGEASHPDHGTLTYAELAAEAATVPVPARPPLRDPSEYRLVGQPMRRVDIEDHTTGTNTFAIDVVVPDMVYAAVLQSPSFGGEVTNFDDLDLTGSGADAVVAIPNGVAVVASSWWVAQQALDGLDVQFSVPARMVGLTSEAMSDQFAEDLEDAGQVGRSRGRPEDAIAASETVIEAEYEAPMLAHMAMEPIALVAHVTKEGIELWLGTQYAAGVRTAVSDISGVPEGRITIHPMALGGAFGRKAETDFAIQAAVIGEAVATPVKVIWSREQDVRHDYYRPPVRTRITGGLDAEGRILGWRAKAAGCSIYFAFSPFGNLTGFDDPPYTIDHFDARWKGSDFGIPFGFLRQPGPNKYTFMIESFVDELAHAADMDPVDFRLQHLEKGTRLRGVLEEVLDLANYGSPSVPGAAHGVSIFETGGRTYVAQVAEVSVDEKNRVTVHKVYVAVDIGQVINPDIVRSQVEGCIVFSMSTGLQGKITLTDGAVDQGNFTDYGLIRLRHAPEVQTRIIESVERPGGIGEHAVGGLIPAVTNALFLLTGERVRTLPMTEHGFSFT